MTPRIILFIDIIIVGLIAGLLVGIWLGYNPMSFSASTYLEQQQRAIKSLNTIMPLLGLTTIILTLISAFLQKRNRPAFITFLFAAILLIASGIVTKFGNQPINAIVMTWNSTNMPGDWPELRDKWWSYHIMRSVMTLISFCLIVGTAIRKS
jgi:uncharacterized membrane protein